LTTFINRILSQVEFSPTVKQLATIVHNVSTQLTEAIADFKRLPEILTKSKRLHYEQKEPIAQIIGLHICYLPVSSAGFEMLAIERLRINFKASAYNPAL